MDLPCNNNENNDKAMVKYLVRNYKQQPFFYRLACKIHYLSQ